MKQRTILFYVLALWLTLQLGTSEALAQTAVLINPPWNIPETFLCPSGEDCSQYMWVEPDLTLYVLSMTTNRLAVVPPEGSEARTYDVADQLLQPYPQNLRPGIAPLQDVILLYRPNLYGHGIDILQLDRDTGLLTQLVLSDIMPIVSCSPFPHITRRPFFGVDEQRVVLCSEGPVHHYNVHIVDVMNQTVEQTLQLGKDDLEKGRSMPWAQLEVGLDDNLYFTPYSDNTSIWGIPIPEDTRSYQVKYDIVSQEFSLSRLQLPALQEGMFIGPVLIDEEENKYVPYTGGTFDNPITELYKIDLDGNIIWHINNPPLPNNIQSIMLVDDGQVVIWNEGMGVFIVEPSANAGPDQTITDADNSGSEGVILDGSASSDSDGTIVSYVWTLDGTEIATGATATVDLPVGAHAITLTITDNDGLTAADDVVIAVKSPQ